MKFKNYYDDRWQLENDIISLLEVSIILDDPMLNENKIISNISNYIKNIGLTIHQKKGLIHHLKDASSYVSKLIMLAFKNDKEGLKKHIKETNITKADVLDILLKLDVLTLHIVSYPLRVIDAVTGWDIIPTIKSTTLPVVERAKKAIKEMEYILTKLSGEIRDVLKNHIYKIKELLNLK